MKCVGRRFGGIVLCMVMGVLLTAGTVYAGGACAPVAITDQSSVDYLVYNGQIVLECTADAADASMAYTFASTVTGNATFMGVMNGRYVLGAMAYDGAGTDPSDQSDLDIVDSDGYVFVSSAAGENGENVIDDGDDSTFYFYGPDGNIGYPRVVGHKPWTITWSNNAVNEAVHYLRLDVTGVRNVLY